MAFTADELCQQVVYQIGALQAIAKGEGVAVSHVSFHAAMGNMINRDEALALQVMQAIYRLDPALIIFRSRRRLLNGRRNAPGCKSLTLFLADRAYDAEGRLVPRGKPGAVIKRKSAGVCGSFCRTGR